MLSACPICTEIFTLNSKTSSTVCGHVFHKMCISKWLEDQSSCPRCRSDCNKSQLRRVYISENSIESLIPDLLLIAVKDGLTGQFLMFGMKLTLQLEYAFLDPCFSHNINNTSMIQCL